MSSAPPSVRYSSSASRNNVASCCAFVPVINSRTEITEAPSLAASLAKTVDFPIPGSPSSVGQRTASRANRSRARSCDRHFRRRRGPLRGDRYRPQPNSASSRLIIQGISPFLSLLHRFAGTGVDGPPQGRARSRLVIADARGRAPGPGNGTCVRCMRAAIGAGT